MVANEQKELKKQIGDLIAKGFIRQVSCFEQLLWYLWRRRTELKSFMCIMEDLIRIESLLIPGMLLLWSSRRDRQLPWMFQVFLVIWILSSVCKADDEANYEGRSICLGWWLWGQFLYSKEEAGECSYFGFAREWQVFPSVHGCLHVSHGYVLVQEGRVISYASKKLSMRGIILHMT